MNKIKTDLIIPECLQLCNISSIYKKKGLINKFSSYRGIFWVKEIRSILELLLYHDEYATIDLNLPDSNVGCRKERNIRDNIFVIQAILNETKHGSKDPIDISVYDVIKYFDSLWAQKSKCTSCSEDIKWTLRTMKHIKCDHAEYSLGGNVLHNYYGQAWQI